MKHHTPGPWTVFHKHKYGEWHVSLPMRDSSMKRGLFDNGCPTDNPEADARLIASAPDLLAALEKINEWCCYASEEATEARLLALQQIGIHARAAIATAVPS